MTNGLNNDATPASGATAKSDNSNKTPEHLIHDLMARATEYDGKAPQEPALESVDVDAPKPSRSPIARYIVTPIRKTITGLALTKTAIMTYQPAPRHVALLLMVTILLIVPWLVPSLLAFVLGTIALTYLIVGHDISVRMITTWFNWLKRRDSQGAEVIRARAERVTARLASWLNRLPARWTTGLYLPDFSDAEDFSEKLMSDPFVRLKTEAQNQ